MTYLVGWLLLEVIFHMVSTTIVQLKAKFDSGQFSGKWKNFKVLDPFFASIDGLPNFYFIITNINLSRNFFYS